MDYWLNHCQPSKHDWKLRKDNTEEDQSRGGTMRNLDHQYVLFTTLNFIWKSDYPVPDNDTVSNGNYDTIR